MGTPEEIKKGLAEAPHVKYVVDDQSRDDVHYERYGVAIGYILRDQIYTYITQLESRLAQVERERDAAVHDVQSLCATNYFSGDYCEYCKYREPDGQCFHDCIPYSSEWGWEWRGACAENTKEEA